MAKCSLLSRCPSYVNPCANIFMIVGYLERPKSHIDRVRVCNCNHETVIPVVICFSCQEMWGSAQWSCIQKHGEYEAAEWLHSSDREIDWVDRETNWSCKFWSFYSQEQFHVQKTPSQSLDDFGGLVVSMLASGTQVRGFKPGRSCWSFTGVKILSMPSSGGEVKESVPCRSFAACKRT